MTPASPAKEENSDIPEMRLPMVLPPERQRAAVALNTIGIDNRAEPEGAQKDMRHQADQLGLDIGAYVNIALAYTKHDALLSNCESGQ